MPDSGRLAWYYQTTPHDMWDFDAVQKMILTDLDIGGTPQQVLMQANKNGFFYVLDRNSGQLLSATEFYLRQLGDRGGHADRAADLDQAIRLAFLARRTSTHPGREPYLESRCRSARKTHLVYIPVLDSPAVWVDMAHSGGEVKYLDGFFTANGIFPDDHLRRGRLEAPVWPAAGIEGHASRPER